MQYEIVITLNDKPFFASKENSIQNDETAKEAYRILKEILTESKGYKISIIKWDISGNPLNFTL